MTGKPCEVGTGFECSVPATHRLSNSDGSWTLCAAHAPEIARSYGGVVEPLAPPDVRPEPGCYIAGHEGHYGTPSLVRFAIGLGMLVTGEDATLLDRYHEDNHLPDFPHEHLVDLADRAEAWLNEHHPREGHSWRWDDGEFGLYPDEDEDATAQAASRTDERRRP